jgi:hypothetical protein
MKYPRVIALVGLGLFLGLPFGYWAGWHRGYRDLTTRRQETVENFRRMMVASRIYQMAYSNNPAGITELLHTNQPVLKP